MKFHYFVHNFTSLWKATKQVHNDTRWRQTLADLQTILSAPTSRSCRIFNMTHLHKTTSTLDNEYILNTKFTITSWIPSWYLVELKAGEWALTIKADFIRVLPDFFNVIYFTSIFIDTGVKLKPQKYITLLRKSKDMHVWSWNDGNFSLFKFIVCFYLYFIMYFIHFSYFMKFYEFYERICVVKYFSDGMWRSWT